MSEPKDLILLTQAQRALVEAKTIDEVKDLRDKAAAVKAYALKARLGRDLVVDASTIKLRAERKLGTLLRELELAKAAPGNQHTESPARPEGADAPVLLRDLGITKSDSSRSQRIADLPESDFERYITESTDTGREPTTAGVLRLARQNRLQRETASYTPVTEGIVTDLKELIRRGRKFTTVYADPPWDYDNRATRAAARNHYPTMSLDDICDEPVANLVAERAHLHLWTTNAFLPDAFEVIKAWGFDYKSCFIWVKPQLGIGNYWRVAHEFLLLGVRGTLPFRDQSQISWLERARSGHSRKPDVVRELIEKVSPGPYLEMYGRQAPPSEEWTVYGNQVS